MTREIGRIAVVLVLATACALSESARGAEPASAVAKLFDTGAKMTPTAIAAARAQYEQLKKVAPKDRRIDYAYALVLANQHKYDDALALLSRYMETGGSDLGVWRVKVWTLVQDKQYSHALDEAVALTRRFPDDSKAPLEDDHADAARFLGTVFGYLELARPRVVKAATVLERKNEILARLGDRYLEAFDEGRNSVAAQVNDLEEQRDAERKNVAAEAEREKEQVKTVLDGDKKKIADETEAMQSSHEQLRGAHRELSLLQTQLRSLQQDRSQLGAEIVKTQTELTQITASQNSSTVVDRTRPGDRNPPRATTTQSQSFSPQRYVQANAAALRLALLNRQAIDVDRRILSLQARAQEVAGTGDRERIALEERGEVVRQIEKHAKGTEQRLRRAGPTSTARATALAAKMASFTTYAAFPYEEEKQRVLSWFVK